MVVVVAVGRVGGGYHQILAIYETLSANLLHTYSNIKHTFSIINISFHLSRSVLATELISSLSPSEPYLNLQTFISPVGRMDCPLLIVQGRGLSLHLLLLEDLFFYSDVIFHSSSSACHKTRLQGWAIGSR